MTEQNIFNIHKKSDKEAPKCDAEQKNAWWQKIRLRILDFAIEKLANKPKLLKMAERIIGLPKEFFLRDLPSDEQMIRMLERADPALVFYYDPESHQWKSRTLAEIMTLNEKEARQRFDQDFVIHGYPPQLNKPQSSSPDTSCQTNPSQSPS